MKKIYKNFSLIMIFTAFFSFTGLSQNAWVNEFHYDDFGTDTLEFIEVVIENVENYSLSSFSVVLYNGNNGETYDTKTLDVYSPGIVENVYSFFYFIYPTNGIQNGAPDGLALVYEGNVIPGQFISWEGAFTAVNGPASGMTSEDIGVFEAGELEGLSLQLSGEGVEYGDFTWQPPANETRGLLNNDQSLLHFGVSDISLSVTGIYPNPNNGSFRVINSSSENINASVYNINGQLLGKFTVNPGENRLTAYDKTKGAYIIRYATQSGKWLNSEKIIIQ